MKNIAMLEPLQHEPPLRTISLLDESTSPTSFETQYYLDETSLGVNQTSVWDKLECSFSHARCTQENERFGSSCNAQTPKMHLPRTHINQEYEQFYRFWTKSSKRLRPGAIALEVGIGPMLYSTFPLVANCREIHLADCVSDRFIETRKWLNNKADQFDWSPYIELVLQTEAAVHCNEIRHTTVQQRAAATRNTVTRLLACDLQKHNPLQPDYMHQPGALPAYDLVTAHYCTEAVTSDNNEWREAIANLASLVKPEGFFFLSVCSNLNQCCQYADQLPGQSVPRISGGLIARTLAEVGMNMATLWLDIMPAPAGHPYSGTVLASVQKS